MADAAPGFRWRLQTDDGDATSLRVCDDSPSPSKPWAAALPAASDAGRHCPRLTGREDLTGHRNSIPREVSAPVAALVPVPVGAVLACCHGT